MPYATFEQAVMVYGEQRLLNASPPGTTSATLRDRWEFLLSGQAARIDSTVGRQGYILPIDFTGHDQERDEFALLNINLAIHQGIVAMAQPPEGLMKVADDAMARLAAIAAGTRTLPFAMGTVIFAGVPRPDYGPCDPRTPFDDRFWEVAFQ